MSYESKSFHEHNDVRLPTLQALIDLGWHRNQIVCPSPGSTDKEWRIPKNPSSQANRECGRSFESYPCDIAIFDSVDGVLDPEHAIILIECKLPGDTSGMSELETYLTLEPRARMGVLTNGESVTRTYKLPDGRFKHVKGSSLPKPNENLYLTNKDLRWCDLVIPKLDQLQATFNRLLRVVVSTDGISTRSDDRLDEICNLLLLKLDSDSIARRHTNEPIMFQIRDTPQHTSKNIDDYFLRYCRRNPTLFYDEPRGIRLDDATIHASVFELQMYNLLDISPMALSQAFQVFRSANLKAGEGQYFTPLHVIEAGTKMMGISIDDRVIDPACGTGGFLSQAYLTVREEEGEAQASRWANRHLYGVDIDDINIKIVRALMVGIGDGSTNAYVGDSLRERKWVQDRHGIQDALRSESYSVVLTNPPFGQGLKLSAADARESQYTICDRSILQSSKKTYDDTELGIVFVERAWRLLEPGGRLGIVLPETYFFSKTYEWFRRWVDDHFYLMGVMNIPMEAFQGFCRAKTNFYVFEKKGVIRSASKSLWFSNDSTWVSDAPTIGINKDGEDLYIINPVTKKRTGIIDNKAWRDVEALAMGDGSTETARFVPRTGVAESLIGVPKYSDKRMRDAHDRWVMDNLDGFVPIDLGELVDQGFVQTRIGHGSPSADLRNGSIPYVKVSDLRNGQVNPNSTNMVPLEVAKRFWRGDSSGISPYDIITPARASKNIGEPVMVLPGQENMVITKEVLVFSASELAPFDNFYLFWALANDHVLPQWKRVVFMQTNREDLGERWREIRIPFPPGRAEARAFSEPYRKYYTGVAALRAQLSADISQQRKAYSD